jgi:hypothetical protein
MFLESTFMARLKTATIAALVAIGIATAGAFALEPRGERSPSASEAKQELLDLMSAWTRALEQGDVATIDRLAAYEMVGTDPVGGLWDKSKYLEHVRGQAFKVEFCEFKDSTVHVYGDAAVVTGLFVANAGSKRWPHCVERSTGMWIRRHGSWQCVAWQTMVIAGPKGW